MGPRCPAEPLSPRKPPRPPRSSSLWPNWWQITQQASGTKSDELRVRKVGAVTTFSAVAQTFPAPGAARSLLAPSYSGMPRPRSPLAHCCHSGAGATLSRSLAARAPPGSPVTPAPPPLPTPSRDTWGSSSPSTPGQQGLGTPRAEHHSPGGEKTSGGQRDPGRHPRGRAQRPSPQEREPLGTGLNGQAGRVM